MLKTIFPSGALVSKKGSEFCYGYDDEVQSNSDIDCG